MKNLFLATAALLAGTVGVSMLTVGTAHATSVDPERDRNDTHSPLTQPLDRSSDGISAYKLANHNAAVRYDNRVAMWDCWDAGVTPRFSAWNGHKWVLWAVGEVTRDQQKCEAGKNKIVYRYEVSLKGRPVRNRAYNLLRVKEACPGCYTSHWTLPVLPPGAAADRRVP